MAMMAIILDVFMVLGSTQVAMDRFHSILSAKKASKRLWKSTNLLDCTMIHFRDVTIPLSHPAPFIATIDNENAVLERLYDRSTPSDDKKYLLPPEEADTLILDTNSKYRYLVGDRRYLAGGTKPDLIMPPDVLVPY